MEEQAITSGSGASAIGPQASPIDVPWMELPPLALEVAGDSALPLHADPLNGLARESPPPRARARWVFETPPPKGPLTEPPFGIREERQWARERRARYARARAIAPPYSTIWTPGTAPGEPAFLVGGGGYSPLVHPWPAPGEEPQWGAWGEGLEAPPEVDFAALLSVFRSPFVAEGVRILGTGPR